jgi:hypothetical protein
MNASSFLYLKCNKQFVRRLEFMFPFLLHDTAPFNITVTVKTVNLLKLNFCHKFHFLAFSKMLLCGFFCFSVLNHLTLAVQVKNHNEKLCEKNLLMGAMKIHNFIVNSYFSLITKSEAAGGVSEILSESKFKFCHAILNIHIALFCHNDNCCFYLNSITQLTVHDRKWIFKRPIHPIRRYNHPNSRIQTCKQTTHSNVQIVVHMIKWNAIFNTSLLLSEAIIL